MNVKHCVNIKMMPLNAAVSFQKKVMKHLDSLYLTFVAFLKLRFCFKCRTLSCNWVYILFILHYTQCVRRGKIMSKIMSNNKTVP